MYADYALQEFATNRLRDAFNFASMASHITAQGLRMAGMADLARNADAAAKMYGRAGKIYQKPEFGLHHTQIGEQQVSITENTVLAKPYGNLVRFERDIDRNDPKILLVAPMSGHYATLLRGTVEALLPHNDVYVTDWVNASDVSPVHGEFGLNEYSAYIADFLNHLGPDTHIMAVCQPTVPVLAAVSLMAKHNSPNQPLSMTLMGGPIDTRAAPTEVTKFALKHPFQWFKNNALSDVPAGHAAHGQKVYPGYKQLMGFMGMNWNRHVQSHIDMFNHLCRGNADAAAKTADFYDEYLAVMDLPARFYLDTIDQVFQRHLLPKGEMFIQNQKVEPSFITKTPLLTVEGEKDDISAPGQTQAAHKLCSGLAASQHFHYLQPSVGHYGIFEGRRWREEICPRVSDFVRKTGELNGLKYSEIPSNTRLIPPNFWQEIKGLTSPAPMLQKRDNIL